MLVQNMLANELGPFELLPTERTRPFVLAHFLAVGSDELLHFVVLILQAELHRLVVVDLLVRLDERLQPCFELLDEVRQRSAADVHHTAAVWHGIFLRVLGAIVVIHGVNDT